MLFEHEFEDMLKQYSTSIDDKRKFSGLVKDLFPEQAKNVNLLLMAYNMGIAEELSKTSQINNTFAYRYVKQLVDNYGISRLNADWIVSVWCVCYGARVLGKRCDISLQKQGNGPAIKEDKTSSGRQYGDLFTYARSQYGNGLGVTGFNGEKKTTIIFQNRVNNTPVIEICDSVFCEEPIEEAILTEGIIYIGRRTFAECIYMHQIILPITIKEVGDNALEGCVMLKSLSLPMSLEKLGNAALKRTGLRSVEFPMSVYWLGESLLEQCENLTTVKITDNIVTIPDKMCEKCGKLKKVVLHDNLQSIGNRAFFDCVELDFMIIPDSVTFIGEDAFSGTSDKFIIQCSFGSYAEQYCRKNKIKYQLV